MTIRVVEVNRSRRYPSQHNGFSCWIVVEIARGNSFCSQSINGALELLQRQFHCKMRVATQNRWVRTSRSPKAKHSRTARAHPKKRNIPLLKISGEFKV